MEIRRAIYLDKLIRKKKNGLIKVITGVRTCWIAVYRKIILLK